MNPDPPVTNASIARVLADKPIKSRMEDHPAEDPDLSESSVGVHFFPILADVLIRFLSSWRKHSTECAPVVNTVVLTSLSAERT